MNFKGTKGNWKLVNKTQVAFSQDEFNTKDCDLYKHQYDSFEEMVANAKLIAAAPELLDALKVFVNFPKEDLEGWIDEGAPVTMTVQSADLYKALNAINKALN